MADWAAGIAIGYAFGTFASPFGFCLDALIEWCNAVNSSNNNINIEGFENKIKDIQSGKICITVVVWDNPRGLSGTTYHVSELKIIE